MLEKKQSSLVASDIAPEILSDAVEALTLTDSGSGSHYRPAPQEVAFENHPAQKHGGYTPCDQPVMSLGRLSRKILTQTA